MIPVHSLAVLKASVEGIELGAYFDSTMSLRSWVAWTRDLGLVDLAGAPTDLGAALAAYLDLKKYSGAAYAWPDNRTLETKADKWMEAR